MPGSVENVLFVGYALPLLALGLALWPRHRPPAAARELEAQPARPNRCGHWCCCFSCSRCPW